jgi:hypothetical protein
LRRRGRDRHVLRTYILRHARSPAGTGLAFPEVEVSPSAFVIEAQTGEIVYLAPGLIDELRAAITGDGRHVYIM